MMMLQSNGFTNTSAKFICDKNPGVIKVFKQKGSKERVAMDITALDKSLKGLTAKQLNKKGVRLAPNKDTDRDGVKNSKACRPLDKKWQGIIHDFIKKKEKKMNKNLKEKQKQLEKEQDNLLKNVDKESTTLKKHLKIQSQINDNKRIKEELKNIKKANFEQTAAGKILVSTKSGAVTIGQKTAKGVTALGTGLSKIAKSKGTKKFLKSIFG